MRIVEAVSSVASSRIGGGGTGVARFSVDTPLK